MEEVSEEDSVSATDDSLSVTGQRRTTHVCGWPLCGDAHLLMRCRKFLSKVPEMEVLQAREALSEMEVLQAREALSEMSWEKSFLKALSSHVLLGVWRGPPLTIA
jgi:hypothetical protein